MARLAAIPYPAIPSQIQRQTIKVWRVVLSDCGAQILQIVTFFLTYAVHVGAVAIRSNGKLCVVKVM